MVHGCANVLHAESTLAAILAIAEALESPIDDLGPSRPRSQAVNLTDGSAGTALLFAYLAQVSKTRPALGDPDRWAAAASIHLDHAVEGVGALPMPSDLFAGCSGVAWSVAHISRLLGLEIEIPDALDLGLLDLVASRPWMGDFDLISGLIGFGVYFLERLPDPIAVRALSEIVQRLGELSNHNDEGIAWHMPPARLSGLTQVQFPKGYFDLGIAHGLAGIISFLVTVHTAGVACDTSLELLEGAVAWLLAREIEVDDVKGFPWAHVPDRKPCLARLGWCYGDPGIGIALLRAALMCEHSEWEQRALAILREVARRPLEKSGIVDVCVCHGSAGLLHIVHRAYQNVPDPVLCEALAYWRGWTLDARTESSGPSVGGFRALTYERGQPVWVAERGLLNGAAGVGLVLLATVSDIEPAWDRMLLLSGT